MSTAGTKALRTMTKTSLKHVRDIEETYPPTYGRVKAKNQVFLATLYPSTYGRGRLMAANIR